MASLRIVGIDPGTSGANQLAAQGLDTVLINDIHGSTALNLVSTAGTLEFFAGGTAASNKVLSIGAGSASFNPNSLAAFSGVTIAGGTTSNALSVTSPATTNQATLKVTQLGTANALEVFGTGAAILQMGDGGTFLHNKTDSDMELFTSGAGLLTINSGSTGGTALTVDSNPSGAGAGISITAGASYTGAANGGDVILQGGGTNNSVVGGTGGSCLMSGGESISSAAGGNAGLFGGNSSSGTGGQAFLAGGYTSLSTMKGGDIAIDAGTYNVASPAPIHSGAIRIGTVRSSSVVIGGTVFSVGGTPDSIQIVGHSSLAAGGGGLSLKGGSSLSSANNGGLVSIVGGNTDSVNAVDTGGPVTISGGTSSNSSSLGGDVTINGGNNSASSVSPKFGSLSLGTATTRNITLGGVTNSGAPGTISITGQGTSKVGTAGGLVSIIAGASSNTDAFAEGGILSLRSGNSTGVGGGPGGFLTIKGGTSVGSTGGPINITGGTSSNAGGLAGGSVTIDAGNNTAVGGDPSASGSIAIGGSGSNAVTLGGSSFTAGAQPAYVSVTGHSSTSAAGGNVRITSGSNTVTASNAGTLSLLGGDSALGNGGPIVIGGGGSSATTKVGGSVDIDAGLGGLPYYANIGDIGIGTGIGNVITIGGVININAGAGTPGDVSLFGHSTTTAANVKGGNVAIWSGGALGGNSTGGDVLIDTGAGQTAANSGVVKIFSKNGDTILIGDGTVVPKVKIRDGYLSFTDTTSGSDSNPSATNLNTVNNALYAKNIVDAWFLYGNGVIQDGFGLSNVSIVGTDITVTFRHAAANKWWQSIVASGWDATSVPAYFVTVGGYTATTARLRLWAWNGSTIALITPGTRWFSMMRLANTG